MSSLPALLHDVHQARLRLAAQRHVGRAHPELVAARATLLGALERYTQALEASGRPVPYRMRDELNIYRELRRSNPSG